MENIVTIRLKKKVTAKPGQRLFLKDIAVLDMQGDASENLQELLVCKLSLSNGNFAVIDVIDVMKLIRRHFPSLDIRYAGPPQTLIEIQTGSKRPSLIAVIFAMLVLFIGSGLTIMNFHMDVSMPQVHERIYYLITGVHKKSPLILQIPYSLGIGIGIFLFFNRLFKKRFNEEPSPLELEMYLYQENIDQYIINDDKQKADCKHHESGT
ncbi:stage V sporulation protein AA [Thermoactinomyces mirandus]|uniref:Stage V sporulation protein AA n=1 Tax=Thermoactinomyces mirandus TaxID=2756294 RepID=A0A7W1XPU6_9BACL|nr:stage V sporulation protein AA [Thermoactinomyces mirandus]MBA4600962.1 stage V sporulation protein AA [Thermoactinomyces mirandus]